MHDSVTPLLQGGNLRAKYTVSEAARKKAGSKRTGDGLPIHSLCTLLADLATLSLNEVTTSVQPDHPFKLMSTPTALQARVFEYLGVDPHKIAPCK